MHNNIIIFTHNHLQQNTNFPQQIYYTCTCIFHKGILLCVIHLPCHLVCNYKLCTLPRILQSSSKSSLTFSFLVAYYITQLLCPLHVHESIMYEARFANKIAVLYINSGRVVVGDRFPREST